MAIPFPQGAIDALLRPRPSAVQQSRYGSRPICGRDSTLLAGDWLGSLAVIKWHHSGHPQRGRGKAN